MPQSRHPVRARATYTRKDAAEPAPSAAPSRPFVPADDVHDDRRDLGPDDRVLLVVEDDLPFADVIVDVAHRHGFKAVVASRGVEALALARELRPHAITLDLKLPDVSGWRVLRQLKKDLALRHIPVHVISVEDELAAALAHGALAAASKPLTGEGVDAAVARLDGWINRAVRSLLLVSQKPIHEVTRIAMDRSSRSTQALTRILCEKLWRIQPEFFEAAPDLPAMLQQADAALLIGDPALRFAIACAPGASRNSSGDLVAPGSLAGLNGSGSVHIYDIVENWFGLTRLPAVLAVWAARREAVTPELVRDFQDSLAFGLQHVDSIASEAALEMNLPAADLRRYLLENIDYHLEEENLRGLTVYYEFAAKLGLISQVNTIALAPEAGGPARYLDVVLRGRGNSN